MTAARGRPVVHVVPALFGNEGVYGGAERYVLELARSMARVTPTRLVSFGEIPFTRRDGPLTVSVVRNWVPYRRFQFDPFALGLAMHLGQAGVIHVHQTSTMMASLALVLGRLGGRGVFTTHLGGGGQGLHRLTDVSGWYAAHLHISHFSRRAFGQDGLASAKVVGGGIDRERFHPPATRPTRDYVLFAGRLLPHKGVDDLIEAVPPGMPLVVAGRPWKHAAEYHATLRRLAVGKRVTFVQDADDARLTTLYQNARCVVLPSVNRASDGRFYHIPELLGQTALEGMACGTAAVVTDVASLPEVVDSASGLIARPNDPADLRRQLVRLWDDPDLAERLGAGAERRVREVYNWDRVVGRCLDAYREFRRPNETPTWRPAR